jgi:hypothetical protein
MLNFTPDQQQTMDDITEAIRSTGYGGAWPPSYNKFFRLWGFFNGVYNALYTDGAEWQRIARFSLDNRFAQIWNSPKLQNSARRLASQACVGDGRNDYLPLQRIRIAFHTMRSEFKINLETVCESTKCQSRRLKNMQICLGQNWPNAPQTLVNPDDAQFTLLGATLLITYQIRNNLFHGSKDEIHGPEYARNQLLVELGGQIVEAVLEEIDKLMPH